MKNVNTWGKEKLPFLLVSRFETGEVLRTPRMAEEPDRQPGTLGVSLWPVVPDHPRRGTLSIRKTSFPICRTLRLY